MLIGCAAPEPTILVEPDYVQTEPDTILEQPVVTMEETPSEEPQAATDQESPQIVTAMDPRVDQLQATVQQLQIDVQDLQAAQTATTTELRLLGGRVEDLEAALGSMEKNFTSRFNNFDAEIARIREALQSGRRPGASPEAAQGEAAEGKGSPEAQPAQRDLEAEIALAVDAWRQAWQNEDIEGYMKLYSPTAKVTRIVLIDGGRARRINLNQRQLRERMERLAQEYARMEVTVRGFRVFPEGDRMVATFDQEFNAWASPNDLRPAYGDRGIKTLVFREYGTGQWLIVEENWAPLMR